MANLAPCPDCRNQVSFSAVSCPKCGRIMKPGDLPRPVPVSLNLQSSDSVQRNLNIGCLIAIAILFVAMAFCCASSQQSPEDIDREFHETLEWEHKHGIYK